MAAIPSELAAAALFGTTRGAFTGADRASPGYFDQAQGGSLFLDEIGDAALDVQPLLLRALQQREIQSVGGPIRKVDVRVLSATDAALDGAGSDFKAALRHRLGAIEILLPPLREHPEDLGELLWHFLQSAALVAGREHLLPHAQAPGLLVAAWAHVFFHFASYPWPGNVRELANFARQVIHASDSEPVIPEAVRLAFAGAAESARPASPKPPLRRMQDVPDSVFAAVMTANSFEVKRVARQLGVSRTSVYRRIEASTVYRLVSEISEGELRTVAATHNGDTVAMAEQLQVSLSSLQSRLRILDTD